MELWGAGPWRGGCSQHGRVRAQEGWMDWGYRWGYLQHSRKRKEKPGRDRENLHFGGELRKGRTEPWKGDRKIWRVGGPAQRVRFWPKRGQCPEVQNSPAVRPCSPSHPTWCPAELDPILASWPGGLALCVSNEALPSPITITDFPTLHLTELGPAPEMATMLSVQGPRVRKSPAPFPTSDMLAGSAPC